MYQPTIKEQITRRRRQMLVHSFIYYRLNDSVISDHQYDFIARDLIRLQEEYPDIAKECPYHEDFKDFQMGDSFALPLHLPEVHDSAHRLLRSIDAMKRSNKGTSN